MLYFLWILSIILFYFIMKKMQKKRINQLLDLIDALNKGEYSMPIKTDDFAILEDQIYKLFLRIVEEKEETKRLSAIQLENLENIAHQIKSPITGMLFDLESLNEVEEESLENEKLINQLNRLNSLTDILLKMASLDAQVGNMKTEKLLVEEVFSYVLELLEDDIDRKSIKILEEYNLESIDVNFYWFSEAILNILKNAINLPNSSLISIKVSENPIFTSILIEDNGGGIDEKYRNKIFKRFYKRPDSNGFGIGLSMAKTIIENNNGEISLEEGRTGARFNIKIYKKF